MHAFKGTQVIRLGEVDYTLAIDIEIIDAIEDDFDASFDVLVRQALDSGRVGKTARLLRGLLLRHHPDISLDDIGGLVMEHGEELGEAVVKLLAKATPEPEGSEAKAENPPKARRGTGASSSSRGARQTSRRTSSGSRRREPCS